MVAGERYGYATVRSLSSRSRAKDKTKSGSYSFFKIDSRDSRHSEDQRDEKSMRYSVPTTAYGFLPLNIFRWAPLSERRRSVSTAAAYLAIPALFPHLFPIPHPARHLVRQRKSKLVREHTHLPAMMSFMSKHVAQHFRTNRPGLSPAVSAKHLDAASIAKRLSKHLRAASGALGQSRAGLLRRAARPVELCRQACKVPAVNKTSSNTLKFFMLSGRNNIY